MQFDELISLRRSVRSYKGGEITKEQIERILLAAQAAPSWKNSETGRYFVALSKEAVEAVYDALPDFNKRNTANASAYIVCAFEKGKSGFTPDGGFANVYGDEWGAYDLGCQNMMLMLKAREEGIDTLVMGLRDEEKLRRYFGIPDSYEVMPVIALGYRAVDPIAPVRKAFDEYVKIK